MNLFFCLACGVFVGCGIVLRPWGVAKSEWRRWTKTGPSYLFIFLLKIQSPNDPNGSTVQQFKTDGIVVPLPGISIYNNSAYYNFKRFVLMNCNFLQFLHFVQKHETFSSTTKDDPQAIRASSISTTSCGRTGRCASWRRVKRRSFHKEVSRKDADCKRWPENGCLVVLLVNIPFWGMVVSIFCLFFFPRKLGKISKFE